ncbi:O-antigen ligase family protein [Herbiconiux sp. P16]|uniref:O-antigen ligase family protein n=1 Tax=Herbiconiux wuyangfengii TaxID=3342794 RepID=UPI0035B8474E
MQLIVWLVLCAMLSFLLRKRPVALIGVALALRVAIPSVGASLVTGQEISVQLQPATYFLMCAFLITLLSHSQAAGRELGAHFFFYLVMLLAFVFMLLVTVTLRGPQSVVLLVDTFGMGLLLLILVRVAMVDVPKNGRSIAIVFVCIAIAESAVALTQWFVHDTIFWKSYMANFYWYSPTGTTVTGTIGALLDVGMLLAIAVPLTASIPRPVFRFSAALVLILGILATERRTPLIVALLGLLYLLIISKMPSVARVVAFVGVGVAGWVILASNLIQGVTDRFNNDVISGQVRNEALDYFLANIDTQPWYGGGFGANGAVQGLLSSFENGYTMYAWDFGVFIAAVIFGALIVQLLLAVFRRPLVPGALVAFAAALFLIGTYSGLQTQGPGSWILFFTAGLCAAKARDQASSRGHERVELSARPGFEPAKPH